MDKLWIAVLAAAIRRWILRWRDNSGRHNRRGKHEKGDDDR